jgi:H+/gluconate symporter-like permease
MFYDRNNVFIGIALGIVFPIVTYAVLLMLMETWDTYIDQWRVELVRSIKPRTLALVSLCIDIFVMRWYQKRRFEESMRGVLIAIGIYAVIWLVKNGSEVLS